MRCTSWTLPAHAAMFTSLPGTVHGCTNTDGALDGRNIIRVSGIAAPLALRDLAHDPRELKVICDADSPLFRVGSSALAEVDAELVELSWSS